MRFADDILYIIGVGCLVTAAFLINCIFGIAFLGVVFIVSAFLVARYKRSGKK